MGIFARIEDHGNLLSRMIQRTRADLAKLDGYGGEATLRSTIGRCIMCSREQECRAWLAEAEVGSPPPSFCSNAGVLSSLKD